MITKTKSSDDFRNCITDCGKLLEANVTKRVLCNLAPPPHMQHLSLYIGINPVRLRTKAIDSDANPLRILKH